MKQTLGIASLCLLGLTALSPARALDVSVLFQPASQTGAPGSTVNYAAQLTNLTSNDLWISGATFNLLDSDFVNSGSFGVFNGAPGAFQLLANQTLTVPNIVSLVLDPSLPLKTYAMDGTFTGRNLIDVGNNAANDIDLGTGALSVTAAAPVPEAPLYQMSALLVLGGIGWRRMRHRQTQQSVPTMKS